MSEVVVLESGALRVEVWPTVGGTIAAVVHKGLGLSVLGRTPWDPVIAPLESFGAPDEWAWLTRYGGGWPLLFPNGGDACRFRGAVHGFHGEASISPWRVAVEGATLRLERNFYTVPVTMRRTIAVAEDVVAVTETARVEGGRPVTVMWGHHPTFGTDLLAGEFVIETGARTALVDKGYDPPANPLLPGARGAWPAVPGKAGPIDLRFAPRAPVAAQAYLLDFEGGAWAAIRRSDGRIAAALSWDAAVFPFAWLWYELEGNPDPPWHGRTRLIGLEPNTTCLGGGLAEAQRRGERLLELRPGEDVTTTVRLHVFRPRGPISGVGEDGRAVA